MKTLPQSQLIFEFLEIAPSDLNKKQLLKDFIKFLILKIETSDQKVRIKDLGTFKLKIYENKYRNLTSNSSLKRKKKIATLKFKESWTSKERRKNILNAK